MQLRSGLKKNKTKMHDEHDILYENTTQDLLDMYPSISLKKIKSLKKIQDKVLVQNINVLDIVNLDCTDKKREKMYELLAQLEMSEEYTEEYFELKKKIQAKIAKIKNPELGLKQRIELLDTTQHNKNIILDIICALVEYYS